jgi:hypothetical protein
MTLDDRDGILPSNELRWSEIDALLDGQAVDRTELRSVLADAEARDYMLDALVLRQLARDVGPSHFVAPARPRHPAVTVLRTLAAVLVLTTGVAGGYFYGARQQHPPASDDVAATLPSAGAAPTAPAPTQTIRFEPGVNWASSERGR